MPVFRYSAVSGRGRRIRETITAQDREVAAGQLRARGLTVIELYESGEGESGGGGFLVRISRVGTKTIVLFFRMFAALVASGIPISEAIEILWSQMENRRLKHVLLDVKSRIEGGTPLSQAMAAHRRVFGGLVTSMVAAGELGGILDLVLEHICSYLENKAALRSKLITSMIYPAVVVIVAVVVIIFLVTFVIPKFAMLLGGRKLPANTQFLLDVAAFLTGHAVALGIGTGGALALFVLVMAIPETRIYVDRYKIYLPVIGPVFRLGAVVQFAKTLSSLLKSGITLVDALGATADTVTNLSVRRQVMQINDKVLAGEPLSTALAEDRFFPPMVMAMVQIGEHSGLMDRAWTTVGDINEKILADKIARMSAMVEPSLIIVLGGIVGYVAWGLISGMLAMYAG